MQATLAGFIALSRAASCLPPSAGSLAAARATPPPTPCASTAASATSSGSAAWATGAPRSTAVGATMTRSPELCSLATRAASYCEQRRRRCGSYQNGHEGEASRAAWGVSPTRPLPLATLDPRAPPLNTPLRAAERGCELSGAWVRSSSRAGSRVPRGEPMGAHRAGSEARAPGTLGTLTQDRSARASRGARAPPHARL